MYNESLVGSYNFVIMKKVLVTILTLVYLSSSVGANIYRHYCMDRLVAWGVGHERNNPGSCPYCGMTKANEIEHCVNQAIGCCHDLHKQIKIEKDQKTAEESFKFSQLHFFTATAYLPFKFPATFRGSKFPTVIAHPQTGNVSLFLLNNVFRI